jgi:nitroreductase/NAD-dependent dihydropyrimidine dehydrogenase PreA subunit
MSLFAIDRSLCKRDGLCVAVCPASLVREGEDGYPVVLAGKEQHCIRCGHCAAVCPSGAFTHHLLPPESFEKIPKAPPSEALSAWMKARRSMRRYKDKPVPAELIARVLDVARYAPSGHNTQCVSWTVVGDRAGVEAVNALVMQWSRLEVDKKSDLAKKLNLAGALRAYSRGRDVVCRGAPVLALAHAPVGGITPDEDGVIATAWFELAAWANGLGSCFDGYVMLAARSYPPLTEALGIPADRKVCGAAMLGYPALKYRLIPPRNPAKATYLSGKELERNPFCFQGK